MLMNSIQKSVREVSESYVWAGLINFGISWVDRQQQYELADIYDSLCFLKVPVSDDYEDQSYVQAPARVRGSSERITDGGFEAPKSNHERLIDKLKSRPITTTPESVTTNIPARRGTTKQPAAAKKTKYTPITR